MRPFLAAGHSVQRTFPRTHALNECFGLYYTSKRQQQYSTCSSPPINSTFPRNDSSNAEERPRWSYTPQRLKMPVRVRLNDARKPWESNSDPKRLDLFYTKLFGPGGDKLLSEEIKWLAITHKSFEQGARGFNDRLAFLGRRIFNLQTNLMLLSSPVSVQSQSINVSEPDERTPFRHPALQGLPNLFHPSLAEILSKERLAAFAASLGMKSIIRWYPRMKHDLNASGIEAVLVTSLYAIAGALALEKGGQVSTDLTRKYIIKPLISR
ncbi:hypothetical protein GcM3_183012 [Golovinomyces cichoracearum]|uniref:RNase III domain-containing protein n=1 Tax=Golovinomyces cichoracearum TaxID=62708 RepID=A0A420HL98_9PEZI|nr:hypothetical protein GcM3_183012 [Golovinomyces cichoracearum]